MIVKMPTPETYTDD